MQLTVVDGNNFFRRRIETVTVGSPLRSCFYELHNKPGVTICVWDGIGGLKPRRELHPDYKVHRKPAGESIYESQNLFKKLLGFSGVIQVQVNGYEGDDVIAHLVKRYETDFPNIYIESNDLDLYQLGKPMARDKFPDKPQNIRLYKTLVGDPSDNIPGCRGFGKTSWEKLSEAHKRTIERFFISPVSDLVELRVTLEDFFPLKCLNWLVENYTTMQIYYRVVGFIDVPTNLIEEGTTSGLKRTDLAEDLFRRFLL